MPLSCTTPPQESRHFAQFVWQLYGEGALHFCFFFFLWCTLFVEITLILEGVLAPTALTRVTRDAH